MKNTVFLIKVALRGLKGIYHSSLRGMVPPRKSSPSFASSPPSKCWRVPPPPLWVPPLSRTKLSSPLLAVPHRKKNYLIKKLFYRLKLENNTLWMFSLPLPILLLGQNGHHLVLNTYWNKLECLLPWANFFWKWQFPG